ncbi:50S ribosomal protein L27 [Candidatus Woesebacteria bacterium]|nr:50S ribosomal protein L27 [Candidatus Woesebacteria bacterium]
MSKKKAAGKTKQNIRRTGKSLGLKVSEDQVVSAGAILIKQRGTKYHAGDGVDIGRDHTLFALKEGKVKFGKRLSKTTVSVV